MVISGDWQKNPRLQPTCGWARRCQTKHSAQRFSREDLSPVASQWGSSPQPQLCIPLPSLAPPTRKLVRS